LRVLLEPGADPLIDALDPQGALAHRTQHPKSLQHLVQFNDRLGISGTKLLKCLQILTETPADRVVQINGGWRVGGLNLNPAQIVRWTLQTRQGRVRISCTNRISQSSNG